CPCRSCFSIWRVRRVSFSVGCFFGLGLGLGFAHGLHGHSSSLFVNIMLGGNKRFHSTLAQGVGGCDNSVSEGHSQICKRKKKVEKQKQIRREAALFNLNP
ncbi:unnamed protein product, partial [Discosporangium mesarthrocarpum]